MSTMKVSLFNSMRSKVKRQIDFTDYITLVRQGMSQEYISDIKKLRKIFYESPKRYKNIKETLPIITPHAIIEGKREDANVIEHSGIVSVDVDTKDNDQKTIDKFNDPLALGWHKTISGEGLVIYYKVEIEKQNHRAAFEFIAKRLKTKFGITADPHVKALSVPRFISYDPAAVFNPKARPIKIKTNNETVEDMPKESKSDQQQLRDLTEQILKEKAAIVDDRESWIKVAAIFCRAFGGNAEGLDLFDSISRLSEGYKNKKDCATVYRSFNNKKTSKPATIGSLIYLMEESGMEVDTGSDEMILEQFAETDEEEIPELLQDLFLVKKPPSDIPVIQWKSQFNDDRLVNVCTKKNYSTAVGKMKSGKTFLLVYLINSANVKPKLKLINKIKFNFNILVFDTEQGAPHVWAAMQRVNNLKGWMPATVTLRAKSYKERIKIIRSAVKQYQPELIIIDGIRDLMADFNGIEETSQLITYLEKLTNNYDNHIINVLHLNKTDENARGHIGTELLNRSETIIRVDAIKTDDGTIHKISCEYSRGEPFKEFGLKRTEDVRHGIDYPELCELPDKKNRRNDLPVDEVKKKLDEIFGTKFEIKGGELTELISKSFNIGFNSAKKLKNEFVKEGYIKFVGSNPKDPKGKFKILLD